MYSWIQPEKSLYYQANLIKDLFGDWTLVSSWGVIDSRRGRVRKTGVPSYQAGLERINAIRIYPLGNVIMGSAGG